jgi:hypothetical protein
MFIPTIEILRQSEQNLVFQQFQWIFAEPVPVESRPAPRMNASFAAASSNRIHPCQVHDIISWTRSLVQTVSPARYPNVARTRPNRDKLVNFGP